MANLFRIKFAAERKFLLPGVGGTFSEVLQPTNKAAFPVVTALKISIEFLGASTPAPRQGQAVLEIIGRPRRKGQAQTGDYELCALIPGVITIPQGSKVHKFTSESRVINNTRKATVVVPPSITALGSDFLLPLSGDGKTVEFRATDKDIKTFNFGNDTILLPLPWVFDDKEDRPHLQLNARLFMLDPITKIRVLESDESINTPLDIPLTHDLVPDDGVPNKPKEHPLLTFFGVRNIYPRANLHGSPAPRVSFAGRNIRVVLHKSTRDLCGPLLNRVIELVRFALDDAGFRIRPIPNNHDFRLNNRIQVVADANAETESNRHFTLINNQFLAKTVTGQFATDFSDQLTNGPKQVKNPKTGVTEDSRVKIPDDMALRLPFFDFFIFALNAIPPGGELAHGEGLLNVPGSTGGVISQTGEKAIANPIILAVPIMRRKLSTLAADEDKASFLALVICHEIGHTFGLRHALCFKGSIPHKLNDPDGLSHGIMCTMLSGVEVSTNAFLFRPSSFGPVHKAEIEKMFFL